MTSSFHRPLDHSPPGGDSGCPEGAPLGYAARPMIIDGKAIAAKIREEIAAGVAALLDLHFPAEGPFVFDPSLAAAEAIAE